LLSVTKTDTHFSAKYSQGNCALKTQPVGATRLGASLPADPDEHWGHASNRCSHRRPPAVYPRPPTGFQALFTRSNSLNDRAAARALRPHKDFNLQLDLSLKPYSAKYVDSWQPRARSGLPATDWLTPTSTGATRHACGHPGAATLVPGPTNSFASVIYTKQHFERQGGSASIAATQGL